MMGLMPADFAKFASVSGASFIGATCGIGPAELLHSVLGILTASGNLPVVAKVNCVIPTYVEGVIHDHGTPKLMAEYALLALDVGAKLLGCCGTSPAHVGVMFAALDATPIREFDEVAVIGAFGDAHANVNIDNVGGDDRCKRRAIAAEL